jgi:hypothetical protein
MQISENAIGADNQQERLRIILIIFRILRDFTSDSKKLEKI